MNNYTFAYVILNHVNEVQFGFPKFPEIHSFVNKIDYEKMTEFDKTSYASDAVVAALQARIATKQHIPESDDPETVNADGFIALTVQQAMKLELFRLYKKNNKSISDFARTIDKKETSARRLLDLSHISKATEIELAINSFGKILTHSWELKPMTPSFKFHRAVQRVNT